MNCEKCGEEIDWIRCEYSPYCPACGADLRPMIRRWHDDPEPGKVEPMWNEAGEWNPDEEPRFYDIEDVFDG